MLYGERITAQKALEIGLVNNKVVPDDQLETEARLNMVAARLAKKSSLAVQTGKKAFYAVADLGYAAAFEMMNKAFARLCNSDDASEGVAAFLREARPGLVGNVNVMASYVIYPLVCASTLPT